MRKLSFLWISLLLAITVAISGCKQEGCTDINAVNYDPEAVEDNGNCAYPNISLNLASVINGSPVSYGEVYDINGVKVSFSGLQFYASGVGLGSMGEFTDFSPYLLVKADQEVYELGEGIAGHQHMLRFHVGIDSVTNHADPSAYAGDDPLAFQSPSMHWSWNNGYIFLRVDGLVDLDGDQTPETTMEFHIGKDVNLTPVMLEVNKEVQTEEEAISLEIDWAKLFTGMDLTQEYVTHTGDNLPLAAKTVANISSMFSKK
ncbi:MAG: MbnP family protein [Bacteroidota bacterium]